MTLYLLPNVLDEEANDVFVPGVRETVRSLKGLIAESESEGRKFLRRFVTREELDLIQLRVLNEHTPPQDLEELLKPLVKKESWGLISDAGLPCLADPGSALVRRAHAKKIAVKAFAGPSSMVLALQLSGLEGQRFSFHGYLPREEEPLKKMLRALELRSKQDVATQLWIEAPYRSAKLAKLALEVLNPSTLFCIALSLTSPRERLATQTIAEWRKAPWTIEKEPAVFLLQV